MIGCFDTKAREFEYLKNCLVQQGLEIISINTGIRETNCEFPIDINADEVAESGGTTLVDLVEANDRSSALATMGTGAALILQGLYTRHQIHGAVAMGGGGGTFVGLRAMQGLPIGVPKICLSTVATKDLSTQVGPRDVLLMPAIVDIAGLNGISMMQISQAAGALKGMIVAPILTETQKQGRVAISIFGNTTPCVNHCTELLGAAGYDVLTFHAVGSGGRAMEALIDDGYFDAVLDVTITELADELCSGICSAGPDRLTAAVRRQIPQVVVPGCLDMINFGSIDSVPSQYHDRKLFSWAPDVTLMRTSADEYRHLATEIAEKLNHAEGRVAVVLPTLGLSIVGAEGGEFHEPQTDAVLFASLKNALRPGIVVHELSMTINDARFSEFLVDTLLELFASQKHDEEYDRNAKT